MIWGSCLTPLTAAAQVNFELDSTLILSGWLDADLGWWEDPCCVSPRNAQTATAAYNVYDSSGQSTAVLYSWNQEGDGSWVEPFGPSESTFKIEALTKSGDRLLCGINALSEDSTVTSLIHIWAVQADDSLDPNYGSSETPGRAVINFGSPYQEMHGLAPASDEVESPWMISGMVLDPCCFHREMPALALLTASGVADSTFGANGQVVVDVSGPAIADTLGIGEAQNRHELGGFYACAIPDGSGWIAAGAYSNAAHYEILVVRHLANGEIDSTYGEGGLIHLNLNPGVNHWVEDLALDDGGNLHCLVQTHSGGDWPPGWHHLVLDPMGVPVVWASLELGDGWKSAGFVPLPSPAEFIGFGFLNSGVPGVPGVPLACINVAAATTDEPTAHWMDGSNSWNGTLKAACAAFHPDWNRLLVAGRGHFAAPDDTYDAVISHWSPAAVSGQSGHLAWPTHEFPVFPNPSRAGSAVSMIAPGISSLISMDWDLFSVSGKKISTMQSTTPGRVTTLILPHSLLAGIYVLRSSNDPQHSTLLLIE